MMQPSHRLIAPNPGTFNNVVGLGRDRIPCMSSPRQMVLGYIWMIPSKHAARLALKLTLFAVGRFN